MMEGPHAFRGQANWCGKNARTQMESRETMATRDAIWLEEKEGTAVLSRTPELMWKDFRRLTDAMLGLISATENG
jgi:hypothetical protein